MALVISWFEEGCLRAHATQHPAPPAPTREMAVQPMEVSNVLNEEYEILYMRWLNECFAPEILPFDHEMVYNMTETMQFLKDALPDDPPRMREIRQIDMERVAYWLRDYLRIRLWKLMQYTQHYLGPTATEVLSPAEKVFAKDF